MDIIKYTCICEADWKIDYTRGLGATPLTWATKPNWHNSDPNSFNKSNIKISVQFCRFFKAHFFLIKNEDYLMLTP